MPEKRIISPALSPEVFSRVIMFIKKYVDKNQIEAAKQLGVSQGTVSNIFIRKRPPSPKVLRTLMTKFHMNQDWLVTGEGSPVRNGEPEKKKSLMLDLGTLQAEIESLTHQMRIYEVNQNHLFKVIDAMEKRLESANI
jgi:transcriptional regulator with XRE-family HTH domain